MPLLRYVCGARLRVFRFLPLATCRGSIRAELHTTPACRTDGVYADLTNMRVKAPWIEALRKQREGGFDPTKKEDTPSVPTDRDLRPKKMADSFHRVVCTELYVWCSVD